MCWAWMEWKLQTSKRDFFLFSPGRIYLSSFCTGDIPYTCTYEYGTDCLRSSRRINRRFLYRVGVGVVLCVFLPFLLSIHFIVISLIIWNGFCCIFALLWHIEKWVIFTECTENEREHQESYFEHHSEQRNTTYHNECQYNVHTKWLETFSFRRHHTQKSQNLLFLYLVF